MDIIGVDDLPAPLRDRYREQRARIAHIRRFTDGFVASYRVTVLKIQWVDPRTPVHKWKAINDGEWIPFGEWTGKRRTEGNIAPAPATADDVEARAAAHRARTRAWR